MMPRFPVPDQARPLSIACGKGSLEQVDEGHHRQAQKEPEGRAGHQHARHVEIRELALCHAASLPTQPFRPRNHTPNGSRGSGNLPGFHFQHGLGLASAIRQRRSAAFCRLGNCPLSIRRSPIEFLFE